MTNDLTHATAPPKPPATQTRAQADLLGVYRSRITLGSDGVSWSITEGDQPTGRDLELMQARRAELASFKPAEPQAIAARIARLFLRFPGTAKGSPEQVAAYVTDLKRFPLWAIDKGLSAVVQGHVLKATQFAPSSLEVQNAVRKALEPAQTEFALIGNVLNATVVQRPIMTPEERARAVEDWRKHGIGEHVEVSA